MGEPESRISPSTASDRESIESQFGSPRTSRTSPLKPSPSLIEIDLEMFSSSVITISGGKFSMTGESGTGSTLIVNLAKLEEIPSDN